MNPRFMRMTSHLLMVSFLSLCLPFQAANASLMATDKVAATAESQSGRDKIRAFLEREDVSKELQSQGIDGSTAKARVDALTDAEVMKVAGKLDNLPAGGEILGILFSIFVILLITDILGFTSVFSFTHSAR